MATALETGKRPHVQASREADAARHNAIGANRSLKGKTWCSCKTLLPPYIDKVHRPGFHELPQNPSGVADTYITLRASPFVQQGISSLQLDLEATALKYRRREQVWVAHIKAREEAEKRARQEEIVRQQLERERAAAAARRVGFLTLHYGHSFDQRKAACRNWPSRLLVRLRPGQYYTSSGSVEANQTELSIDSLQPIVTRAATRRQHHHHISLPATPDSLDNFQQSDPANVMDDRRGIKIEDGGVGDDIRNTIFELANFQSRVHGYRPEDKDGLTKQLEVVGQSLKIVHDKAADPTNPLHKVRIAQEIIDYVDDGRNPDIFTRDFVDLVQRGNAVMSGKQKAFKDFSKIFAKALKDNFDGMDADIDMVMANAGMVEKNGKFVDKEQNGIAK